MSVEARDRQPDESSERGDTRDVNGPQAEAVPLEVLVDMFGQRVAFLSVQHAGKVFHDTRVGIECGKRLPVGWTPSAEDETFGRQAIRRARPMPDVDWLHRITLLRTAGGTL